MIFRSITCLLLCIGSGLFHQFPVYGQLVRQPAISLKLPALIPYRAGNLWGYADSSGTIKISPKYRDVQLFTPDKIAWVATADGWGFIDENGNEILKPSYKYFYPNIAGLAIVGSDYNSEKGVVNLQGKEIVPLLYKEISIEKIPGTQTPLIKVGNKQHLSLPGKPNTYYETITNYGLYTSEGKQLLPVSFRHIILMEERLIIAIKGEEWTVIDDNGTVILPPGLHRPGMVREGLLLLCKDQKCGFLDLTGKVVIPLQFDYAERFSEGRAAIKQKEKWGFINKKGQIVITPAYDQVRSFHKGFAIVQKGKRWGLIDTNGVERSKFKWDEISFEDYENVFRMKSNYRNYMGIIDEGTGKIKFPKGYYRIGRYQEGLAPAVAGGNKISYGISRNTIGYVNQVGKFIIPRQFEEANQFYKGMAVVRKNGYYGVIDRKGNTIIPMALASIYVLDEDLLYIAKWAGNSTFSGLINREGEEIIPVKYSRMQFFDNGFVIVHTSNNMSVVDLQGREIYPPLNLPAGYYLSIEMRNGLIQICKDGCKQKGFIDFYGRVYLKE